MEVPNPAWNLNSTNSILAKKTLQMLHCKKISDSCIRFILCIQYHLDFSKSFSTVFNRGKRKRALSGLDQK